MTILDGILRIGDTADGLRIVDDMSDGVYTGTVIGNQQDVVGELRLQNSAEFTTSGDLVLGATGNATLRVESGSRLVSNDTQMSTSTGTVFSENSILISGLGSEWANSGSVVVGTFGDRSLAAIRVESGALLTTNGVSSPRSSIGVTGSTTVRIDGQGSSWVNSGPLQASGFFSLSVTGGARAVDHGAFIGSDYFGTRVLVDGVGSEWRTGNLGISVDSAWGGGLFVQNGGTVLSDSVGLTTQTGQMMHVDGHGSSWQISSTLSFGGNPAGGASGVSVTNGGLVRTGETRLTSPTGVGSMFVEGPGSRWISDGISTLGGGDTSVSGRINILDGGTFESGATTLSCGQNNDGGFSGRCTMRVSGTGSAFKGSGGLYVGGDASEQKAPGRLIVENDGTATAKTTVVAWTGADIRLDDGTVVAPSVRLQGGDLEGHGLIDGVLENQGRVAPAAGGSPLEVTGRYFQSNTGTLAIELREYGDESVLDVLDTSVLAGSLDVTVAAGFEPQLGDRFEIMRYKERIGEFTSYSGLSLGDGLSLAPMYGLESLVLHVIPEPSTAVLAGLGLGVLASTRRNNR